MRLPMFNFAAGGHPQSNLQPKGFSNLRLPKTEETPNQAMHIWGRGLRWGILGCHRDVLAPFG